MCTAPWMHPTHGALRCGQCMECRLAYSREWAIRITHEARMHERNCFLTLTYDNEHLPKYGQLLKSDLQKFFKRLRHEFDFLYVASGEYGDLRRRPHFHAAMFGVNFADDRVEWSKGGRGDSLYISKALAKYWPFGHHSIGEVTFESAAYIARYVVKRVQGIGASPRPLAVLDDGELIMPNPEFLVCSKGIGAAWFDKHFMTDVFPHGRVITEQGTPAPVPRYYKDRLVNAVLEQKMRLLTYKHQDAMVERNAFENRPERKAARATVASVKSGIFARDLSSKV